MDFIIEKKLFDNALRQVLLGRKATPGDLVNLTAEAAVLTVVALGTNVEVPIVCEATGNRAWEEDPDHWRFRAGPDS